MDKLKTVLTLVAVILVALLALATIGLLNYLLLFGVVCLAAVMAVRLFVYPGTRQMDTSDPKRDLQKVERALEEYKRKHLPK